MEPLKSSSKKYVWCVKCDIFVEYENRCEHFKKNKKMSKIEFPAVHIFKPFFSEQHDEVPQWITSKKQENALLKKNKLVKKE